LLSVHTVLDLVKGAPRLRDPLYPLTTWNASSQSISWSSSSNCSTLSPSHSLSSSGPDRSPSKLVIWTREYHDGSVRSDAGIGRGSGLAVCSDCGQQHPWRLSLPPFLPYIQQMCLFCCFVFRGFCFLPLVPLPPFRFVPFLLLLAAWSASDILSPSVTLG